MGNTFDENMRNNYYKKPVLSRNRFFIVSRGAGSYLGACVGLFTLGGLSAKCRLYCQILIDVVNDEMSFLFAGFPS